MCTRCPFVLKPASRTPIGALIIGEVLAKAPHMPKGAPSGSYSWPLLLRALVPSDAHTALATSCTCDCAPVAAATLAWSATALPRRPAASFTVACGARRRQSVVTSFLLRPECSSLLTSCSIKLLRRRILDPAMQARRRRHVHHRRPPQGPHLHRLPGGARSAVPLCVCLQVLRIAAAPQQVLHILPQWHGAT